LTKSDNYRARVLASHQALGIAPDYLEACLLPLCTEPDQLVDTEPDFYQRPQRLTPAAFQAWTAMKQAAAIQGVEFFLISAFRDLQYQHTLIEDKLARGLTLEQILQVNAAPGFSEHHSGRAVDIGTMACDALVEEFENTEAFQWLTNNAGSFAFHMSYPREDPRGIDYEPWHWCFSDPEKS
jgi:D-alanyl-D-alanine carboxypeptidase